jgi:hypothetical protein
VEPKQIKTRGVSMQVSKRWKSMPTEITNAEKFIEMSAKAKFCAVKRLKSSVKLKLRMPSQLYTLKVETGKAEETIKKLQCEIQEV